MQSTQSEDLHVQIVHSGPTKCIHAPKSAGVDRLFTGGDDFLVRILPTLPLPGVEPHLIEDATEPVTSLDADSRFLVTASEDGSVRLYRHHPVDAEGNATSPTVLQSLLRRESLPLRSVALERAVKSGKAPRVAVCSDELIVKIIDVEDPRRIQLLDGHSRGLRSASWSPVAPLLVTCSTDGSARVTDLGDVEPKFIKSIEGILPITRAESEEASCACWHPSGTYFVMPSKAHELVVISAQNDSSSWSRTGNFYASAAGPVPAPSGSITALAFSPNGRYLASATTNGQVTVWDAESHQAIRHKSADAIVNAISWHPTQDALAWTDNEGTLARWTAVVGPTRPSPFEEVTFDVSKAIRGSRGQIDDIFAGTGLSDDEDDDAAPGSNRGDGDVDDLDDFVVDDVSHSRRHGRPRDPSRTYPRGGHGVGGNHEGGMMIAATRPQPAFQPTSTPMRGQRRYLAYNLLGSVVAVEQESHQTISFESFDTSARRNFRFSDMNSVSMAALAKQGILFAAKQLGEQSSSVFFKPFVAASNNLSSEWFFNLDHGEDVEVVGLGGGGLRIVSEDGWEVQDAGRSGAGIAVVATSKGYLRFLSASGMQLYLWAIGHPVVTLAVGLRTVLVIYRRTGLPSGGFQDLGYKVIDLANFDVIQDDVLPLSKDAHIRWAGFNDQHQPAFYDTNGILFVLDRAHRVRQGRWVPSLNTKRIHDSAAGDASEAAVRAASTLGYWPVALTSSKLMVLFLKGGRSHPEVDGTRHMIQELELQVPLIHREGGTGPLEEKSLRDSMLAMTARDVKNAGIDLDDEPRLDAGTLEMSSDKALLQLIQLACKADKHGRALDAARALHSTRTLEAALKIAAFFHLSSLAERMVALKEALEGRPERVEEESRRWCDPSVRGGPSYSNPALVDIMTRASDRSRDGANSDAIRKRASAALGENFLPPSSRLVSGVLRGHSSTSDRFDSPALMPSSSSVAAAHNTSSRSPSSSRAPQSTDDSYNMALDNPDTSGLGKENLYQRSAEKRKSPADDFSESARLMPKAAKSLNPFARTSSNVTHADRDKQMHKSTSFFERIEPYEKESHKTVAAKQSLLTGFSFRKGQTDATIAPRREVFGETQYPDEDEAAAREESLQLTLERVARANGSARMADPINGDALPETMMRDAETMDSLENESSNPPV